MTIRVGINGFGRIGRLAARAFWSTVMDTSGSANPVKIVHINEICLLYTSDAADE